MKVSSLSLDSRERRARIEQIARDCARGEYQVDAEAVASELIKDALQPEERQAEAPNST